LEVRGVRVQVARGMLRCLPALPFGPSRRHQGLPLWAAGDNLRFRFRVIALDSAFAP